MADNDVKRVFEVRLKEFKNWVHKPIAAAVSGAVKGVFYSVCVDVLFMNSTPLQLPLSSVEHEILSVCGGYRPMVQSILAGSGLKQARTLAVACGAGSAITCVMKELRGKEDVQTFMVSCFGAGAMLSLVTGVRGPEAIYFGVMYAFVQGGLFKLSEKSSKVKAEDVSYDKTRNRVFFTGNAADHRKEMKKGGRKTWFH